MTEHKSRLSRTSHTFEDFRSWASNTDHFPHGGGGGNCTYLSGWSVWESLYRPERSCKPAKAAFSLEPSPFLPSSAVQGTSWYRDRLTCTHPTIPLLALSPSLHSPESPALQFSFFLVEVYYKIPCLTAWSRRFLPHRFPSTLAAPTLVWTSHYLTPVSNSNTKQNLLFFFSSFRAQLSTHHFETLPPTKLVSFRVFLLQFR